MEFSDKRCFATHFNLLCVFSFTTNLSAALSHHLARDHADTESKRTCLVCGTVLKDRKNLAGHYFSKHNVLDPSKLFKPS